MFLHTVVDSYDVMRKDVKTAKASPHVISKINTDLGQIPLSTALPVIENRAKSPIKGTM